MQTINFKSVSRFLLLCAVTFSLSTCKKKTARLALITTLNISEITQNSAKGAGVVYFEGDSPITEKGLCWSATSIPTVSDDKTNVGPGEENFTSEMTGLQPLTRYIVRAYATTAAGTAYGDNIPFTTTAPPPAPSFVTSRAFVKSPTSLQVDATISFFPSMAPITESGIVYGTAPNPVIEKDTKVVVPNIAGNLTGTVTGLTANTVYYVRPYASNSNATGYGAQVQLKTYYGTLTDIDGNKYNTVMIGAQEWMVENLKVSTYRDGTPIPNPVSTSAWSANSADGAYSYYNNIFDNWKTYGALYSWYTVTNSHQLAPEGWHVPNRNEWQALINTAGSTGYLGFLSNASNNWYNLSGTTNSSGFSALPGGMRTSYGSFQSLNYIANFWSTTLYTNSSAYYFNLDFYQNFNITSIHFGSGLSVRLVKNL